jgi:hypothetical protein
VSTGSLKGSAEVADRHVHSRPGRSWAGKESKSSKSSRVGESKSQKKTLTGSESWSGQARVACSPAFTSTLVALIILIL